MNENSPDNVNYEDQSAYDVADMVKQFFRDLPEPLLTSKLGETFLHIYQCKDMGFSLYFGPWQVFILLSTLILFKQTGMAPGLTSGACCSLRMKLNFLWGCMIAFLRK